jgi:hypothetical protein
MVSGEALESGSHVLSVPNAKRRAESILGILGILSGRPTHTVDIPRAHLSTLRPSWWNSSIAERNDDSAATPGGKGAQRPGETRHRAENFEARAGRHSLALATCAIGFDR